jgi:hypothetical protein
MLNFAPALHYPRLVREMNASDYLNPVVDHLYVRFVQSKEMFSKLMTETEYGPEQDASGRLVESTRHEIQINHAGVYFLHNLVSCLLGDHREPAMYFDSAFSVTLNMIEPNERRSIPDMVTHLEREHQQLYARIKEAYAIQPRERFGEGADSIRRMFYKYVGVEFTDISAITIDLVVRFILGHEIGHYIRDNNPDLRARLEGEIDKLAPGVIQDDAELFADLVGTFHSFQVQQAYKRPFQAQLVVLAVVLSFMDSLVDRNSARITFAGRRFSLLMKYYESLGHQFKETADELLFLSADLDAVFMPSIFFARNLLVELQAAAERNPIFPAWYFLSSDFVVRKAVRDEG